MWQDCGCMVFRWKTGKWVEGMTQDSTRWIHQWHAKGSQPGLEVKETSQFLITKSTDEGRTWSEPINITRNTKRPEWWLYAPGTGAWNYIERRNFGLSYSRTG